VTVGFHRGAGRMPPTPAREQWEPPPGWAPPSKPVTSWYDRGDRLAISAPPPEAAAAPAASPNLLEQFVALFSGVSASASASAAPRASAYKGKVTVGFHRGAGRMPPTPAREQWEPPPGWAPPSVARPPAVASWYDSGARL